MFINHFVYGGVRKIMRIILPVVILMFLLITPSQSYAWSFTDSFTASDGTLLSTHDSSWNIRSIWTSYQNHIYSNQGKTDGTVSSYVRVISPTTNHFSVEAFMTIAVGSELRLCTNGGSTGDCANGYALVKTSNAGVWIINKIANNEAETNISSTSLNSGTGDVTWKLEFDNGTINGYTNGNLVASATDSTYIPNGKTEFQLWGTGSIIDNFTVTDVAGATPTPTPTNTPTPTPTNTPTPTPTGVPPTPTPTGTGGTNYGGCTYNIYPMPTTGTKWYVVNVDGNHDPHQIEETQIQFKDGTDYATVLGIPATNDWSSVQNTADTVVTSGYTGGSTSGSYNVQLTFQNSWNGLSVWTTDNTDTCTGIQAPNAVTYNNIGGGTGGTGSGSNSSSGSTFKNCGIAQPICDFSNGVINGITGSLTSTATISDITDQFYEKAPFGYILAALEVDTSSVSEGNLTIVLPIKVIDAVYSTSGNGVPDDITWTAPDNIVTILNMLKGAINVMLIIGLVAYFILLGRRLVT